jgi:hypothetical protein
MDICRSAPQMMNHTDGSEKQEGRILIVNYSLLVLEPFKGAHSPLLAAG